MDVELPATQFFKPETLAAGYLSLYLVDAYARDQGEYPDSPDVKNPADSMSITFTVAGFSKDNPEAVAETPTPEPEKDDASSASSSEKADEEKEDEGGSSVNPGVVAGIVVGVVVVAGVVVAVTRKKN